MYIFKLIKKQESESYNIESGNLFAKLQTEIQFAELALNTPTKLLL